MENLFEPVDVGPVTVPNSLFQPPYNTNMGLVDEQIRHREEKARGGFGLVFMEYSRVHESSDPSPSTSGDAHEPEALAQLSTFADRIHEHGAKTFIQLYHAGKMKANYESRLPPLSSSQRPAPGHNFVPKEMTRADIDAMVEAFARAAERSKMAGFDGVEIHAGHDYLVSQFLSPTHNDRDDEYGGSLENRMRFFREIVDAVRNRVGDDLALSTRFTINEMRSGGLTEDGDGLEIVRGMDDIDFWNVDIGSYSALEEVVAPSRHRSEGYQVPFVTKATEVTDATVGGVGLVTDPETASDLLAQGKLDMIGMARQSIADPHWPNKVRASDTDRIRECIGCNVCIGQTLTYTNVICTTNPTVGKEETWGPEEYETVAEPSDVLVVGGGPAGMEAARVAGERDQRVTLVEKEPTLGGRVNVEASLPDLEEWRGASEWRETELERLGTVTVRTGPDAEMDAEDVRAAGAETVVVATGAHWDPRGVSLATPDPIRGWDLPHVLTPEECLEATIADERVLIFDQEGYNVGAGLAQRLVADGNEVTIVTSEAQPHAALQTTLELTPVYTGLQEAGVEYVTESALAEVGAETATTANVYTGAEDRHDVDRVVLVTRRLSNRDLYEDVQGTLEGTAIESVHAVGDCASPRRIADAVYDGHRIGREI